MNVKKLTVNSLLLAVGAVLHQFAPPIVMGMKPDFSLAILFIILLLNEDYKTCITSGIIAGILAALTTTFPGGQVANIIDKFVTTNIMFLLLIPVRNRLNNRIKIIMTSAVGTIVSGTAFLTSALILVGLPAPFKALFVMVVLPASIINTISAYILFEAVNLAMKRTQINRSI